MTTNIGSLAVSLSLDASKFNGSIEQANRNLGAMASELKASKALGSEYGKSVEGLASKKDILSRSVEASSSKLKIERERYDELAASGKANEIELERQAKRVNEAQAQYNRLSTELASVDKQLKIQSSSWTQYGEKMENAGNKMKSIGQGMTNVGDNLTKKVSLPIAGLATAAFKASVDFESAFAGVRKTVDGTEAEFAMLSAGIRDMAKDIPAAATEIAGVAEAAGQLGIKKEAILGFTRTMTDLGVATNMGSDEAATALARLANITQMNQQDFDRLGSSVVALGNNFATTEREIVDMALRLAGAGAQVGMSEADILALSAALSSVGIEAEMGGSAISRVMVNMQVATSTGFTKVQNLMEKTGMSLRDLQMMASHNGKAFGNLAEDLGMTKKELTNLVNAGVDLQGFSKIAGMTGEQFKKAFEEDAIGALGAFINGLANAEESGESAINMLEEMGISEIRLRDSLLRAGGAAELFANSVDLSNEAWDENNALTKEAEERYKTTASQMKILWNRITDIGISFGEILIPMAQEGMDKVGGLVDKFASLDKQQQENIVKMAGWAIAAGPVLSTTGRMSTSFGNLLLIGSNLSKGIAGKGGLVASLGAVAGPGAIAVGALAAVGFAGYELYKVLNQTSIPEIDIFGDTVSDNTKKAVGAFTELTDEASVQLGLLKASGMTVSEEMAGNMVETFGQMSDTILSEMKEDHAAQLETVTKHLGDLKALSKKEQDDILASVVEGHQKREERVENLQRQYNGIVERAKNERRGLYDEEQSALVKIQREMMETGIKYLSETEREQKVILERIKSESEKISAEQALEISKRARETKEAVIEEAEKTYDEKVKTYLMLRDETKTISQDQYEALVKDAENTRDETIKATDEQYEEVIRISKEKGEEYLTELELRIGRELTAWEKLSVDVGKETLTMGAKVIGNLRQMATDGGKWFLELRNDGLTSSTELARGYTFAVNKLPGVVRNALIDAVAEVGKSVKNFYNAGKDAAQGVIDGWKSKAKDIAVESSKMGINMLRAFDKAIDRNSPAEEFVKSAKDAGRGVVKGLQGSEKGISKAATDAGKVMISAFDNSMKQIYKQADSAAAGTKKAADKIKKSFTEAFAAVQHEYKTGGFTATQYVSALEAVSAKYAKTADSQRKISEEMLKVEKAANEEKKKLEKEAFEHTSKFIAARREANEISLTQELAAWERVHGRFKEGSEERIAAEKNIQRVRQEIYDQLLKANDDFLKKTEEINKNVEKEELRLNEVYDKAVVERTNSIRTFAGLFDEVVFKAEKTGDDLISNLRGQVSYIDQWSYSIEQLAKRGIDKGLLEELRSMGPKAMPELLELNKMTDSQLKEFESLWKRKTEQARTIAVKELTGLKTDTEKQISELHKNAEKQLEAVRKEFDNKVKSIRFGAEEQFSAMKSSLPDIGRHAIEGLMSGMNSMRGPLMREARSIAEEIETTIKKALQVKSPSRKTWAIGTNLGEGLIGGMKGMFSKLRNVASEMAYMALPSMPDVAMGTVTGGGRYSTGQPTSTGTVINQTLHFHNVKNSPSEDARLQKRASQEAALGWALGR